MATSAPSSLLNLPLADAITALMAANFAYLFIINAFVGLLEGKLLKRWFGGGSRAVWWMIAGNYISAWTGWFALCWLLDTRIDALLGPRPIERINWVAAGIVLVSFDMTVAIEFAFVRYASQREQRSPGRTLLATVCVNAISYTLICAWFLWSSYSLPFNARVRPLSDMGALPRGTLYWVDTAGNVIARDLNQAGSDHTVGQAMWSASVRPWALAVDPAKIPGRVEIDALYMYGSFGPAERERPDNVEEPAPLVVADAGDFGMFPGDYCGAPPRTSALDLRFDNRRQTRVHYNWYTHQLDTEVPDGPRAHLHMGLGELEWELHNPIVLIDDKIIFEWNGQILLFDPHTTKLAFIALGTCPAFVPGAR